MCKHNLTNTLADKIMPIVTNKEQPCGNIRYYAQGGLTCYVLRGTDGDLLIDTGMLQTRASLPFCVISPFIVNTPFLARLRIWQSLCASPDAMRLLPW